MGRNRKFERFFRPKSDDLQKKKKKRSSPKLRVVFRPKPLASLFNLLFNYFQLKWLERLILYHINEDNNVQAKLSASQYGFRAGVSTETALHEFVRRVEHCLVRKKPALGIFLDIVGAFDNVTFRSFVAALRGLGMSKVLTSWIENLVRHRTVRVELYGDKVKREVVKGNPQGGILSLFCGTVS